MTISVLQSAVVTGQSGASIILAFSTPITPGSSLWAVCRGLTSTSITAISDSVNGAWTQLGSTLSDGSGHFGAHAKFDITASGTPTVTISVSPNGSSMNMGLIEVGGGTSGFDTQVSVYQAGISSNAPDAVTTGNATPSVAPGLIVAASTQVGGTANTLSAGTGFASISALWGGGGSFWESLRYTSASARAGTFTQTNATGSNYFNFAAFFKESIVNSPTPSLLYHRKNVLYFI